MTKPPKSLTQKLKEAKADLSDLKEWNLRLLDERGRCCRCFHFSPKDRENYKLELSTKGSCHRYPEPINVEGGHFCGEYLIHYRWHYKGA